MDDPHGVAAARDAGRRARARLFDREAERYDRTRPGYPAPLIDDVLGPSPAGLAVLDVACGTGIASRLMAARGAHVLGVELNAGMAEVARQHGIATELGEFETWDAAGRTFDRVTCAQAWHWLDPDASAAKAASVLHPGGRLCLFWNVGHHPDDLADALHAAYERALPSDAPPLTVGYGANRAGAPTADFTLVTDHLVTRREFAAPQVSWFPWHRDYTRAEWVDEMQSHSDHAALEPELRQQVLDEVGRTIDDFGGGFRMTFSTILISAARE